MNLCQNIPSHVGRTHTSAPSNRFDPGSSSRSFPGPPAGALNNMSSKTIISTIAISSLMATLCGTAHATQARVDGLLANPGFADDTDVLRYPSTISGVGDALNLNYAGNVDAGVTWGDSNMMWIGRGVNPSLSAQLPGPSPWQIVYGKANGDTGFLVRSSWQPGAAQPATGGPAGATAPAPTSGGVFSIGGGWGKGDYGYKTSNFAVTGDITGHGAVDGEGEDLKFGIDLQAIGRTFKDGRFISWMGHISHSTLNELTLVGGTFGIGPRLSMGDIVTVLAVQPGLYIIKGADTTALATQLPSIIVSAEYSLVDWLALRGSASGGWLFSAADVGELTKTDSWDVSRAGAIGMSFKKADKARLDVSMSPTWLVAGPHLLSGVPNNTFLTVSGQASF